jgi:hypothetical protein
MKTRRNTIISNNIVIKLRDNEIKNLEYSVQGYLTSKDNTKKPQKFPYILVVNNYYKKTKIRKGGFNIQGESGFYIAVSKKDHQKLKNQGNIFKKFKEYTLTIYS